MQINNGAPSNNGGYFKPGEHASATLIIFEPKSSSASQYKNEDGSSKQNAVGDFTIFLSDNELKQGKPSTIMEGAACSSGVLSRTLIESIGQITAGKLEQVASKQPGRQPYWSIAPVTQAQSDLAVKYLTEREEAKKAALPSFFNN